MLHRVLMVTSTACCVIVAASFLFFAHDQLTDAAHAQQSQAAVAPAPRTAPAIQGESEPRRLVDRAAAALTGPFRSIVNSPSQWVRHLVPTLLALVVYGVAMRALARWSIAVPPSDDGQ